MPTSYLLDTNAYYLLFQSPKESCYTKIESLLRAGEVLSFYISELTQLEIHSVLGKYRRQIPQQQKCERLVIDQGACIPCPHTWSSQHRKKMTKKVYRDILKLIRDVESQKGEIQATVVNIDSCCLEKAKILLSKYSDLFSFNSHDALIAGTVIAAKQTQGLDLTMVTSDKGLKAALKEEGLSHLDPRML